MEATAVGLQLLDYWENQWWIYSWKCYQLLSYGWFCFALD